ncbi:hypothetical protein KLP28_16470 [Nocardioidaceae bacterium]|nr:hypothetical protein KLP28_16470 [Nocardioidaceae bacterium]
MMADPPPDAPLDSPRAPDTAARLLEAQVAWTLRELGPERLGAVLAPDVRALVTSLRGRTLSEVADPAAVRALVRACVLGGPRSALVTDAVGRGAVTAHHSLADSPDRLRDVLGRDDVAALTDALLTLRGDGRQLTQHLLASPTAVTVGVRAVGRIVADVLAQNRTLAEKVPGVGGLISLGTGALNRAGRLGQAVAGGSGLDKVISDALGAGAGVTIRRTSAIIHDTLTDDVVRAITLELYDASADRPVAELRPTAADEQVAALAQRTHGLLAAAAGAEGATPFVDDQVDAFLDAYSDHEVVDLLARLGLTEEAVVAHVVASLTPLLATLRADDALERLVRARLTPFWESPEVAALLAPPGPATGT